MSKSTGHLTVAMVALFVAWPFAAVAQSDWRTSTEVRKLYEAARAEGEVVIWGAQRRELAWLQEPFGKRFPGIEVKWTADRSAATKLITEYRAGRFAVALKQADTLIERAPELAMGWRFKGECLFELQQYGESIVAFRVAQNFGGPGTEDLFLWIALCCARDNRVGDATDVLN